MTKISCNCGCPDGIHEAWCRTNDVGQLYRCSLCNKPVTQQSMAHGLCTECRECSEQIPMEDLKVIKEAFTRGFIADFSWIKYSPVEQLVFPYLSVGVSTAYKITITCIIMLRYEYREEIKEIPLRYEISQIYAKKNLLSSAICQDIVETVDNNFLEKLREVKRDIQSNLGRVISMTFKRV